MGKAEFGKSFGALVLFCKKRRKRKLKTKRELINRKALSSRSRKSWLKETVKTMCSLLIDLLTQRMSP